MGALAARLTDTTAHGGIVTAPGAPTVLIEGLPAARVSDMHTCALVNPGPVPHVGGPILPPGCPTVLIMGMPAARVSDWATCVGPIDVIVRGAARTMIGMPAAAPPAPPGVSTVGGGESSWFYYHHWAFVYDTVAVAVVAAYGVAVVDVVDVAIVAIAGAGVVSVAVLVLPYQSRSFDRPDAADGIGWTSDLIGDIDAFHENSYQEEVRDDAEMYFL
jgi:uncharacterized Zn-binding protein involved in type VI secretion